MCLEASSRPTLTLEGTRGVTGRGLAWPGRKSLLGLPWRIALNLIDRGWILRAEIIWSKPNGLPESVTDRVRRSHEQIFHFVLEPRYYSAVDEIREPHQVATYGRARTGAAFAETKQADGGDGSGHLDGNPLGRLPGSVWTIDHQDAKMGAWNLGNDDYCPVCSLPMAVGNGRAVIRLTDTPDVSAAAIPATPPTDSCTNGLSAQSPPGSPSTISAGTGDASTPTIWNPSPSPSTSSGDGIADTLLAIGATRSTSGIRIGGRRADGSVGPVCACEHASTGPESVWRIATSPLIIPDTHKAHWNLPDHFAAYPPELVRRIILGWSPRGVCVKCGEGRRPVVEKAGTGKPRHSYDMGPRHDPGNEGQLDRYFGTPSEWQRSEWRPGVTAEIVGQVCACTPYQDIPSQRDRAKDSHRYFPERVYDLAAEPPPTRPGVICDPMCGTGTTIGVAHKLGRHAVGTDLSEDYCRLARWRIQHSGHFDRIDQTTAAQQQEALPL